MMTAPWRAICAIVLLTVAAPCFAQSRDVFVTASFIDRKDLFIENLERSEIEVLENGQPRELQYIARDEVPTVYGLIFDRSLLPQYEEDPRLGGYGMNISSASAARNLAYELIDKHIGRHTTWVGVYERELQVALDFTLDGFMAKDAIHKISGHRANSEPFLYSAVFSSVMRMKDRSEKRRVLLFFLDVVDAETLDKLKPLGNLLASSNVEVFFVSFGSQLGIGRGASPAMSQGALRQLAQETAGGAYFVRDFRDHLDELARRIFNHIRTFYTFGFTSNAPADSPSKLAVRCSRPGSRVKFHPNVPAIP